MAPFCHFSFFNPSHTLPKSNQAITRNKRTLAVLGTYEAVCSRNGGSGVDVSGPRRSFAYHRWVPPADRLKRYLGPAYMTQSAAYGPCRTRSTHPNTMEYDAEPLVARS